MATTTSLRSANYRIDFTKMPLTMTADFALKAYDPTTEEYEILTRLQRDLRDNTSSATPPSSPTALTAPLSRRLCRKSTRLTPNRFPAAASPLACKIKGGAFAPPPEGEISMDYGYSRCSTNETKQDINRQVRELKAAGAVEIFMEYEHGDAKVKSQQAQMFAQAQAGDTIIVLEVSRLARSTQQLC